VIGRRGGVLCQWLDVEPDDYLTYLRGFLRGFAAADLCSVGGVGAWLDVRLPWRLRARAIAAGPR
jgi:hypothetical protein